MEKNFSGCFEILESEILILEAWIEPNILLGYKRRKFFEMFHLLICVLRLSI